MGWGCGHMAGLACRVASMACPPVAGAVCRDGGQGSLLCRQLRFGLFVSCCPYLAPNRPCMQFLLVPCSFFVALGDVGPGISPVVKGPKPQPVSLHPFWVNFVWTVRQGSSFFPLHVDVTSAPAVNSPGSLVASLDHPRVSLSWALISVPQSMCVSYARNTCLNDCGFVVNFQSGSMSP